MAGAGKQPIPDVETFVKWLTTFIGVARKHYRAKYVFRIMPLIGGLLMTNWDKIEELKASGHPKDKRFTTTGARLFLKRGCDGTDFIFKFSHPELKLQLTKKKEILRQFDNTSSVEYVWDSIEDLLSGKLN
jgi:hypothetical protein